MAIEDPRQQALDLFLRGTTQPARAREELAADEAAGPASPPPFSPFISEHLQRAVDLAGRLMAIADATPGEDGLRAASPRSSPCPPGP